MPTTICVIGSSNTDMVIKGERLPAPGETVIGGGFLMNPGGKGANQAVAAARLGGDVQFVASLGNDLFGSQALAQFKLEKIETRYVRTDDGQPSGVALIFVDSKGENCISVAPGANDCLKPEDTREAIDRLTVGDIVLVQLEIPLETVFFAVRKSFEKDVKVILNPAPAQALPADLFECLYLITPNETEAELLTGIPVNDEASAREAAGCLRDKGVEHVLITMGSKGVYLLSGAASLLIPAPAVNAVDTTAAGDCFNGALAVALAEGLALEDAALFACRAAAICVTRIGAQSSMPYRKEIKG